MSTTSVHSVGDAAIATARRWAQACRAHPEPRAARLLAAALRHPEGLRFTLDFVDQVDAGLTDPRWRDLSLLARQVMDDQLDRGAS